MSKAKKAVAEIREPSMAELLHNAVVEGLQEKKGKDIVSLNLTNVNSAVADYFVICHADSKTQVEALARSVEEVSEKMTHENPWHKEGAGNSEWILLDYINVVVHIFIKEKRDFYGIERLWADADIIHYDYNE